MKRTAVIVFIASLLFVSGCSGKSKKETVDPVSKAKSDMESVEYLFVKIQERARDAINDDYSDDEERAACLECALDDIISLCYQSEEYTSGYNQ